MNDSILIFACDHRQNVQWNLPYIRFGGPESECNIKIKANKIFNIDVNADEAPKLFWLWENIQEFGNPDIIGYCQYRRFFTNINTNGLPLINISIDAFQNKFAMTPLQQLSLINTYNVDGILHLHFKIISDNINYKYIWEQFPLLNENKMLQPKYQKLAFDLLLKHTPTELKQYIEASFQIKEMYLCNIFTAKRQVFDLFGKITFNAVKELLSNMEYNERMSLFPCWLAYLFERYTSCFYHALELSGKYKFLKVPLLTIDGQTHTSWKK